MGNAWGKISKQMHTIRRATNQDLESLVRLRVAMQQEIITPTEKMLSDFETATRAYLTEALPANTFLAWVADAGTDEGIIATSGLVFFHRPPTMRHLAGKDAYVLNMYTAPEWRGRGIAAEILTELLAYLRTTDTERVFLHAQPAARAVYTRAGFTTRNDEMELWL